MGAFFNVATHLFLAGLINTALASDYHSPRTAALGGSGHAGPLLNDSILLNPSFTSFLPTYSIGVNYLNGTNYSVSIQDGRSEFFQAGVAYSRREDGSFIHVGASKNVVRRLGFGLGAKAYFNNQTRQVSKDMTFSASGIPTDWLQTALIIDNLLETSSGKEQGLYREYILGIKCNIMGIVLAYFDPHYTPSLLIGERWGYETGLEFVMFSDLYLRFGNFLNSTIPFQAIRGRGYGVGLGWVAPRLSLDYALSRPIVPKLETVHTIGTTLYF
jgi:hypothetical protein